MDTKTSPMLTADPMNVPPGAFALYADPYEVAPDVLIHPVFVNTYAIRTPAGLLLIDPGLEQNAGSVLRAVRRWSDAPLHTAVYTHGHVDHAFGLKKFLADWEKVPK